MTTIRGRNPNWVYGIGVQCYQLHRSVISPVLRELIDSWRLGRRNKIIILTKSLLFQNLEEQIPSAKSVKTHFQKVKETWSIENCHLCTWRHHIKMLNQAGRSQSRTKPTGETQPSFLPHPPALSSLWPPLSALLPNQLWEKRLNVFCFYFYKSISDLIFLNSDLFSRSSLQFPND